jgi:hypothetical protein
MWNLLISVFGMRLSFGWGREERRFGGGLLTID